MKPRGSWSRALWAAAALALVLLAAVRLTPLSLESRLGGALERADCCTLLSIRAGQETVNRDLRGPEELAELTGLLSALRLQYRGGYSSILTDGDNPPYRLYLWREDGEETEPLGELELDWQGNVYIGRSRYAICGGDEAGLHAWIRAAAGDSRASGG